jgi:hypothetical protein
MEEREGKTIIRIRFLLSKKPVLRIRDTARWKREGKTVNRIRFVSKKPVLRIQDGSTGSRIRIFPSRIQGQKDPGSGSAYKRNKVFLTQKTYF